MPEDIKHNYLAFLEKMNQTALECGRKPEDIQLVVVTKWQSAEKISKVVEAGGRLLGENYPEETSSKIPLVNNTNVKWHMIGHLQSRKCKFVVDNFSMIHSIDRTDIAVTLSQKLMEANKTMQALFEVNMSGEQTKNGFAAWDEKRWDTLIEEFVKMEKLPGLRFTGLMTMPPYAENPEDSREYFVRCRKLLNRIQDLAEDVNFYDLSLGTSLDYEVAIQEGATLLRIGQAILGERTRQ
jgi:pyridoxal phosphate enzyme (YggS family)